MIKGANNKGNIANVSSADPIQSAFNQINNTLANVGNELTTVDATLVSGANSDPLAQNILNIGQLIINATQVVAEPVVTTVMPEKLAPSNTNGPEFVNVGTLPNDGTGDLLSTAFDKINNNFANIFSTLNSNVPLVQIPTNGSLTQAFTAINENFSNVFSTIDPNTVQSYNNIGQFIIEKQITPQIIQITPPAEVFAEPAPRVNTLQTVQITGPVNNQEWINIGAQPNDGTGDPLRVAFDKINNNFTNLFWTSTSTTSVYTDGLTPDQLIFEYPANQFTQAVFQIRSSDPGGDDSQDITISAQIKNGNTGVKYTGYAITFEGNAVSRYGMDVLDGNVRLLASPLLNTTLLHFISSEITFIGNALPGVDIGLNGYIDSVMGTEDGYILTTEGP